MLQQQFQPDSIFAEIKKESQEPKQFRLGDIAMSEKLDKFMEDVR